MAYKQRADGSFRMRASFPISSELVERANRVCELEDTSMYRLCRDALARYVDDVLERHEQASAEQTAQDMQAAA